MSKNISIKEGGTAKTMTVNKLKTDVVGGGTCLWVPEDEVSVGTKHITQNGTYESSSDSLYGYKTVTVNVAGGAGSADSGGKPTTSGGSTPGGVGSAVIGTDPTDGNEYAVGVDDDGNLVKTKVPSSIAVVKDPNKTEYVDGETIDYSGIIVSLKGGDGEPFANADYPNGHVPFSELKFPIEVADSSGVLQYKTATSDVIDGVLMFGPPPIALHYDGESRIDYFNGGTAAAYMSVDNLRVLTSKNPFTWEIWEDWDGSGMQMNKRSGNAMEVNYRDVTFFYSSIGGGFPGTDSLHPKNEIQESDYVKIAYTMLFGSITENGIMSVPVQWDSPYDGRTFETTTEITVTAAQETGGDEGGGGGHSF